MRVGAKEAMEGATRYGIMSPLENVPSGVLGSNVVTAMDMAAAYSTFANRGIKVPPVLVTRITRADGTVLYTQQHHQSKVLEAGLVDTLTGILEQVIERGTGTRAKLDRPAAGKTGTTDDNNDAWFAGYTPQLATAVWVGFPILGANEKLVPMRPPNTPISVTGGSYPAEIWQRFMSASLAGRPVAGFVAPTTTTTVRTFVAPAPGRRAGRAAGRACRRRLHGGGGHRGPRARRLPGAHRPGARGLEAAWGSSRCSPPPAGPPRLAAPPSSSRSPRARPDRPATTDRFGQAPGQ